MTFVLPLPVTPSRTCWDRPSRTPATSCSMASGWSPAGLKGASTLKVEGTGTLILGRTDVRKQGSGEPGALPRHERSSSGKGGRVEGQSHGRQGRGDEGQGA